jgi:hypothetical protein
LGARQPLREFVAGLRELPGGLRKVNFTARPVHSSRGSFPQALNGILSLFTGA